MAAVKARAHPRADQLLSFIRFLPFAFSLDVAAGRGDGWRPSGSGVDQVSERPERRGIKMPAPRSEEHTSELQSLMRISYAVFCLKKKTSTQVTKKHK